MEGPHSVRRISWEPLNVMFEDFPSKFRDIFSKRRETALTKRAKLYLKL